MKKSFAVWIGSGIILLQLSAIVLYVIYVVWTSSYDHVATQKSDLEKYPELMPFVHQMTHFISGMSDIERGVLCFAYVTDITNVFSFFADVDAAATDIGWEIIYTDRLVRTYRTNLMRYSAQLKSDTVILKYDEEAYTVHVTWQ